MSCTFVEDNGILWLLREKVGNPPAWESGKIYKISDLVVPRNPTAAQANIMFQAVGYLTKTPATAPAWPAAAESGDTIVLGDIEYEAQLASAPPPRLSENQYFILNRTITVN